MSIAFINSDSDFTVLRQHSALVCAFLQDANSDYDSRYAFEGSSWSACARTPGYRTSLEALHSIDVDCTAKIKHLQIFNGDHHHRQLTVPHGARIDWNVQPSSAVVPARVRKNFKNVYVKCDVGPRWGWRWAKRAPSTWGIVRLYAPWHNWTLVRRMAMIGARLA